MTTAPKPKTTYTPAPEGTQLARCYQIIQIGTLQEEYMGKPKMMNKIRLSFELPLKTKIWKEGEPAKPTTVHKEYTFSMAEKANLRKLVEGMIGTTLVDTEAYAFDIESLVGMECLLNLKHKTSVSGNVRAEIASASPLMEGQTCPPQFNPSNILMYSAWDQTKFEALPDFLKEKMMESEEFKNKTSTLSTEEKAKIEGLKENSNSSAEADKAFEETNGSDDIDPTDIPF